MEQITKFIYIIKINLFTDFLFRFVFIIIEWGSNLCKNDHKN